MPNCFQLTRKGETQPATLSSVDEAMCEHFGAELHPTNYYHWWFDSIGFKLSMGKSIDEIINYYHRECQTAEDKAFWTRMIEIAQWLEENYTVDTWAEIGRR